MLGGGIVWIWAYWEGSEDLLGGYPLLSVAIEGWCLVSIVVGLIILILSRGWALQTGVEWGWIGIRLGGVVLLVLFGSYLVGALDRAVNVSLITSVCLWSPAPLFGRLGFQTVHRIMALSPGDFQVRRKHHLSGEHLIFVSYRREDSQAWTDRITDELKHYFGLRAVFHDVESIPAGVDFRQHLRTELSHCQAMLVIIGLEWLNAKTIDGSRRLDHEEDWVRVEIEIGLQRRIPIIPVFVGKASVPSSETLPETIKALAFQHALPIRGNPDFRKDMDRLIEALEQYVQ
jgi:hypothetical protein